MVQQNLLFGIMLIKVSQLSKFKNDNKIITVSLNQRINLLFRIAMLNYQPANHDETLDPLIQQILPDVLNSDMQIQQSLKKQLMAELQVEAQLMFEKEFQRIQGQVKDQFEIAIYDLEEQGKKLLEQQTQKLKRQLHQLQKQRSQKQASHYSNLQQRYISQNFQELILTHKKIKQIENELTMQILENSEQKIEATKQRRVRQLAVKMENKEQKYRKDYEKSIKNQIYQSRAVDEVRKDLEIMKIGVASMKSEYNIKIKKIDDEIKQIKQKNRSLQPKQSISDLQKQLQQLQTKRDQQNEKILNQQTQIDYGNKNKANQTFSHLDQSSENHQMLQPPHFSSLGHYDIGQKQPVVQENDYTSNQSESESDSGLNPDESDENNQCLVRPPIYELDNEDSREHLKTFENHAPILKLNVASLLRTNWQDPLKKYVIVSNPIHDRNNDKSNKWDSIENYNNENDSRQGNKSSFQQIYHQHLQKLNQATKRRKLSIQAKNTIMKNLSMIRKHKF